MTREDLTFLCAPILAIAIALKLDIATPDFSKEIASYVSWVLTGIIAGLTPIVGPLVAQMMPKRGGS